MVDESVAAATIGKNTEKSRLTVIISRATTLLVKRVSTQKAQLFQNVWMESGELSFFLRYREGRVKRLLSYFLGGAKSHYRIDA